MHKMIIFIGINLTILNHSLSFLSKVGPAFLKNLVIELSLQS